MLYGNENTLSVQILAGFFELSSAAFAILQICRVNFSTTFYIVLFVSVCAEVLYGSNNCRSEQRNKTVNPHAHKDCGFAIYVGSWKRRGRARNKRAGSDVRDRQNTTVEFRVKTNLRAISKYSRAIGFRAKHDEIKSEGKSVDVYHLRFSNRFGKIFNRANSREKIFHSNVYVNPKISPSS